MTVTYIRLSQSSTPSPPPPSGFAYFYLDVGDDTWKLMHSNGTIDTPVVGPAGPAGTNGKTILNGVVNPTGGVGVDGDFYINTATETIFGPKAAGVWPSGVLYTAADWANPGTIGSTTPNSATFTGVQMNGRIVMAEGTTADSGYLFNETSFDTGWTSPSDGVMHQYGNGAIGSKWGGTGPTEINGVAITFPGSQGASADVLHNDGAGALYWAPGGTAVTGSNNAFAGFDNTGALVTSNFGWLYDNTFQGVRANQDLSLPDATNNVQNWYSNAINPTMNIVNSTWTANQTRFALGTDDSGFSYCTDGSGQILMQQLIFDSINKSSWNDVLISDMRGEYGNGVDAQTFRNWWAASMYARFKTGVSSSGNVTFLNATMDADAGSSLTDIRAVTITGNVNGTFSGNYSGFSLSPNVTTTFNSFLGYQVQGNYSGLTGGFFGMVANPQISALGGQFRGVSVEPTITTSANSAIGYFLGLNIGTVTGGTTQGLAIGGTIGDTGAFEYQGISVSPQITTGSGDANGIVVNMGGCATSGQVRGIQVQNGRSSFQQIDAFGQQTVVTGSGNPASVHSFISSVDCPASGTITNDDTIGTEIIGLMGFGANSTSTASAFGIGVAATFAAAVVSIFTGATVDQATGGAFGMALDSGNTGGTIDTASMVKAFCLPEGGTQTITNLIGFDFALPFGDPGTYSWGLYDRAAKSNWMNKSLKIGGVAGSTDRPANDSCGLELETLAVRFANLDTTARNALTALAGMVIYNTTTDKLQVYAAGSWADLN